MEPFSTRTLSSTHASYQRFLRLKVNEVRNTRETFRAWLHPQLRLCRLPINRS